MADLNPINWWKRLLALPNDSQTKTIAVAVIVSAVCAVVVSGASVTLRSVQQANLEAEKQARIEAMIAELPGLADILQASGGDSLETLVVDLRSAELASDFEGDATDLVALAADPDTSTPLDAAADIAGIGAKPNYAQIIVLRDGDKLALVILPVFGKGFQSTIQAYLALEGDLNTVAGMTVTAQGDTPGLGARVEDAAWQALWPGTKIADENGEIVFEIVKGTAASEYQIDGITGATYTSTGMQNIVRFWMGEDGYGPVLDALKAGDL